MLKKISYEVYEKEFYRNYNINCLIAFRCEFCGKVFRYKHKPLTFNIPFKFPTLNFTTPGNYNSLEFNYNFCSLSCLFELLKNVPFGFSISVPSYFSNMDKRNELYSRDWEEVLL